MKTRTGIPLLLATALLGACDSDVTGSGRGDGGGGSLADGAATGDAGGGSTDATWPPYDAGPPPPPPLPPECLDAANRGLAWLVTQQNADGTWGGSSHAVATTGFAVLKLETHAWENGRSPFDASYQYHAQVMLGLQFLFSRVTLVPIGAQTAGSPDTNGTGQGAHFGDVTMYENAIGLMAIAGGRDPAQVVAVPGSEVDGWTYLQVAQELVDHHAFAQSDNSGTAGAQCLRGGWRYDAFDNDQGGDNSVSQFVTLALEYAMHPLFNFKCTLPDFVKLELAFWVECIQMKQAGDTDEGGSGYTSATNKVNSYKTGALIQQAAFLGEVQTAPWVQAALAYLERHWDDGGEPGWRGDPAEYLAMYSIMKGMESHAIADLNGIDWYRDFCDVLVAQQNPDGSWPSSNHSDNDGVGGELLSTEWALLVLERAAPPPPVID